MEEEEGKGLVAPADFNRISKAAEAFGFKRTCEKCIHFKVCAIPVKVSELKQFFLTEKVDSDPATKNIPFKLGDIAMICKFYSSRVELLNSESIDEKR